MRSASSKTDQLLQKAAAGDRLAKEQLFSDHRSRLRRMIAVRMNDQLLNRIDPSDVVQDTLLQADRRFEEYLRHRPLPFLPWLRQLAWDQLVMLNRKHLYAERRSRHREDDYPAGLSDESVAKLASCLIDDSGNPLSKLVDAEVRQRVRQAMNLLPNTLREIVVLRYLEHLTTADAARALGITVSAAKMRHLRAIEQLRELLRHPNAEESQ